MSRRWQGRDHMRSAVSGRRRLVVSLLCSHKMTFTARVGNCRVRHSIVGWIRAAYETDFCAWTVGSYDAGRLQIVDIDSVIAVMRERPFALVSRSSVDVTRSSLLCAAIHALEIDVCRW